MMPPTPQAHIDETIQAIARLHAEHRDDATPFQRLLDRMTALLSHPGALSVLTLVVGAWIGVNLIVTALGHRAIDPPPCSWLGGAVSLASLYLVILLLTTQRREDQFARYREHLILELALLGEQKTAKVITLLEELRRDDPLIGNRTDKEAEVMARPADPQLVLDAIKDTHAADDRIQGSSMGRFSPE